MAENSSIAWTDATWNPWIGCTEVSPACDHCYARAMAHHYRWAQWGNHPRHRTAPANWKKPAKWNREAAAASRALRVFTCSLGDFFDNQVPEQWRHDAWAVIERCECLDWLILTKRPGNIRKMLPANWGTGWDNVWLGITVENQEEAERRIPLLLSVPASVHWLSCEPLLGQLDLRAFLRRLDWVICGGESGPGRREMDPAWARALRDQCAEAHVPFFMKQMTAPTPHEGEALIPPDLMVRQFPASA